MTGGTTPQVGLALTPLRRCLRSVDLVAYAGATWDWHRLHFDQAYAAERGLPGPIVDGQMFGALLVEQVQDEFGPRAQVTSVVFRFASMVYAGEPVRVDGRVVEVEETDGCHRITVDQEVTVDDEEGRTAVKGARTVVEVPVDGQEVPA